jgi:hypothetical protein
MSEIAHMNVYLLNHPDLIESVLVTDHHNFIKGRTLQAGRVLLGGCFWPATRQPPWPWRGHGICYRRTQT